MALYMHHEAWNAQIKSYLGMIIFHSSLSSPPSFTSCGFLSFSLSFFRLRSLHLTNFHKSTSPAPHTWWSPTYSHRQWLLFHSSTREYQTHIHISSIPFLPWKSIRIYHRLFLLLLIVSGEWCIKVKVSRPINGRPTVFFLRPLLLCRKECVEIELSMQYLWRISCPLALRGIICNWFACMHVRMGYRHIFRGSKRLRGGDRCHLFLPWHLLEGILCTRDTRHIMKTLGRPRPASRQQQKEEGEHGEQNARRRIGLHIIWSSSSLSSSEGSM